jgi:hypothetical protein
MKNFKPFLASSILFFDKRVFGLSGKNNKNIIKPNKAGMNGKASKQCHRFSFPLLHINYRIEFYIFLLNN